MKKTLTALAALILLGQATPLPPTDTDHFVVGVRSHHERKSLMMISEMEKCSGGSLSEKSSSARLAAGPV